MKKWQLISIIVVVSVGVLLIVATIASVFAVISAIFMGFATAEIVYPDYNSREDHFKWLAQQPWIEVALPYPQELPQLTFLQRATHPRLAEYDYKIRIQYEEETDEKFLSSNYGGRTRMDVFWHLDFDGSGPIIHFKDHSGEYLLVLNEQEVYGYKRLEEKVLIRVSKGVFTQDSNEVKINRLATQLASADGEYLGRFEGYTGSLKFIPADEIHNP